jgi:hypothetical protein
MSDISYMPFPAKSIASEAVISHWRAEFNGIAEIHNEKARQGRIKQCYMAAQRLDIAYDVRSDHRYFSQIKDVFRDAHLNVKPVADIPSLMAALEPVRKVAPDDVLAKHSQAAAFVAQ